MRSADEFISGPNTTFCKKWVGSKIGPGKVDCKRKKIEKMGRGREEEGPFLSLTNCCCCLPLPIATRFELFFLRGVCLSLKFVSNLVPIPLECFKKGIATAAALLLSSNKHFRT